MKLSLLAVLLSVTQTPIPVPRKATHDPIHATRNTKDQAAPDQAIAQVPPSPVDKNSAARDENTHDTVKPEDAQKSVRVTEFPPVSIPKNWTDYTYWFFTLCLVTVGGLQVWLLFRTFKVSSRQGLSMRRQTTVFRESLAVARQNAESARLSAEATQIAANAARASADALIGAERAWILAKPELPEKLQPAAQNTLTRFKWSIKNVGRTPARIVETDAVAWRVADMKTIPKQPRYEGTRPFSMNDFLLVPGDSIPIYWMIEPGGDALTIDQVEKIKNLKLTLFAYGFVKYVDIFGKFHTTRFCHTYVFRQWKDQGFEPYVNAPPEYSECD